MRDFLATVAMLLAGIRAYPRPVPPATMRPPVIPVYSVPTVPSATIPAIGTSTIPMSVMGVASTTKAQPAAIAIPAATPPPLVPNAMTATIPVMEEIDQAGMGNGLNLGHNPTITQYHTLRLGRMQYYIGY